VVAMIDVILITIAVLVGINLWGMLGLFVLYMTGESTESTWETIAKSFLFFMHLFTKAVDEVYEKFRAG